MAKLSVHGHACGLPVSAHLSLMRSLIIAAALVLTPAPVLAQAWTDPIAATAEEHQRAMERLNARADQRAAFARRQQIEADIVRQRLQLQQLENNARDLSGLYRDDRDPTAQARIRSGEYGVRSEDLALEAARRREDAARRLAGMDAWYARSGPR